VTGATGSAGATGATGPAGSGAAGASGVATYRFVFNNQPWVAGLASTLTVTVVDAFGSTATGYRGTVHFTSSDPNPATLPADYTFTAADLGVHAFANGVTLFTLPSQTVTATDTLSPSITGTAGVLLIVGASSFNVAVNSVVAVPTAGVAGHLTVTALDGFGSVVSGYRGTVHFATSAWATLPADYTFTATDGGTHTFANGATIYTAGLVTVTATDTLAASITGRAVFSVEPGRASNLKIIAPAGLTAGLASSVTVAALDAWGNSAPSYNGTIHFTSTDSAATLPTDFTFSAVANSGTHTFTNGITLRTAGLKNVVATDTVSPSIWGGVGFTVIPGAASTFRITIDNPSAAGVAASMTVTALDSSGNTASKYTGSVRFTSSDPAATVPADYQFTLTRPDATLLSGRGDDGAHTFSGVTFRTRGTQNVVAIDIGDPSINGIAVVIVP
jgi:hypothetical protein